MSNSWHASHPPSGNRGQYQLRLYVAGPAPRSIAALRNLETICEEHLAGRHQIEVIDLLESPHLAQSDNIVAVPTLVRSQPKPAQRIVGILSNATRVLAALELPPESSEDFLARKEQRRA